ncbi:MAG TPA: matrixin family metalloprotease [Gemmatimonadaceae bacterium]|nr:matrixin family metalloprotease [Gemmatimonadaceae bacterium]
MRRPALLLVLLLVTILAAREYGGESAPIAISQDASLADAPRRTARRTPSAPATDVVAAGAVDARPADDIATGAAIRDRIRQGEQGTYISEILLARDSALARWPDRRDQPLRVWVADGSLVADWDESFPQRVRDAFTSWESVGIPVRFTFVVDSADADIHVTWVDHFDTPISGKTLWSRDRRWWIVGGNISLALHHNGGEALDASSVYAIALHEVGHLLGLDHTVDTANIMTPKVRVRELSDADRATLRLLYSLPAGSVR